MGAAVSAHLANCGVPNLLLDIKPGELTDDEKKRGLSLGDRAVANRLALAGVERARKSRPAAFYDPRDAELIGAGNLEDDLERLKDADWVIEAIIENLDIKRRLFESLVPHLSEQCILSTNTSGISVAALAESLPGPLRGRFMGTHFFNPPRYLRLLELIPGPETDPQLLREMGEFGERILGKGIVFAKDTPNFIANRIGTFAMFHALRLMEEGGYSIAEVDRLTGPAMGRPKSATFRTADLVGLDTLLHVAGNMYENLPQDPERDLFRPPEFVETLVKRGWLGQKSSQGFYKKVKKEGKSEILMLDPGSMDYVPSKPGSLPAAEMVRNIDDPAERLRILVQSKDRAGEFVWKNLSATLLYAARNIPEISDDVVGIDRAMRWGFGWELGPFEIWDALGVSGTCRRMEEEGLELPENIRSLQEAGAETLYKNEGGTRLYFDFAAGGYQQVRRNPRQLVLSDVKAGDNVVLGDADASLVDLGDGVACLEFHTKMNTIGPGIISLLEKSLDLVEKDWRGLVIGNEAPDFSVGANLLLILNELDDENDDEVEWMVSRFQNVNQRVRFSRKPVVVTPRGRTLGGGCEVTLAADRVCAAAETYIGLVEIGAGVIPAGGGCKEMVKRVHETVFEGAEADLFPLVQRTFETMGLAKVSTGARNAVHLGYLRPTDHITINPAHLIYEAKQIVLAMDEEGYRSPRPLRDIRVVGEAGLAAIRTGLNNLLEGGFITEYDRVVGDKLAWVLCGGDVGPGARVSEDYLLGLERRAFMDLCLDPRTQARMEHILKTGKPLRN
jgi:3-hydroxyacyl-CoA dehydrogenase